MRSACPINLATELLGDRWSLVILRDMMFGGRRTYRDLLTQSLEGIATNILASRLRHLEREGFLSAAPDPGHSQRTIYSLTEKAIALVPVMATLGDWGVRFLPVTPLLASRAKALAAGGPPMWQGFMDELREIHLGVARAAGTPSVLAALEAAYQRTERRVVAADRVGRTKRAR